MHSITTVAHHSKQLKAFLIHTSKIYSQTSFMKNVQNKSQSFM